MPPCRLVPGFQLKSVRRSAPRRCSPDIIIQTTLWSIFLGFMCASPSLPPHNNLHPSHVTPPHNLTSQWWRCALAIRRGGRGAGAPIALCCPPHSIRVPARRCVAACLAANWTTHASLLGDRESPRRTTGARRPSTTIRRIGRSGFGLQKPHKNPGMRARMLIPGGFDDIMRPDAFGPQSLRLAAVLSIFSRIVHNINAPSRSPRPASCSGAMQSSR